MIRRDWLKTVFSYGAVSILSPFNSITVASMIKKKTTVKFDKNNLLEERKKTRRRMRRIIMNNDGDDVHLTLDPNVTVDQFLDKRTKGLINHSHVDTIFYSTGRIDQCSHLSKVAELPLNFEKGMNVINAFKAMGTDTLTEIVKFCKENNKEVFWSVRMNDNHDASRPSYVSDFKKNHPGYLVGQYGVDMPIQPKSWSMFDYGVDAVRKHVEHLVEEVVTNYNIDGIELDFFRHPGFFKAQFYAEDVTQEMCDLMTEMIKNIRTICDKAAVARGRVILIAVRVPDSIGYCKAIGIDLERWLKENFLDLIIGADYFKLEPWKNWAALGRKYNVPAYACLERRRMVDKKDDSDSEINRKIWRGEAYMAWKSGINGIYTFNRFNPKDPIFWELGDPQMLEKLERIDQESYVNDNRISYSKPEYWLKEGRRFLMKE